MKQAIFLEKIKNAKEQGLEFYQPISKLAQKFESIKSLEFYWHLYI